MIELEEVGRDFGEGPARQTALEGVTVRVQRGEFIALAGPSGSGKTTLLNLAAGLDRPSRGRVLLEGRDLASLSEGRRADLRLRAVGFVFQDFHLVPVLDAGENAALPMLFRSDLTAEELRRRAASALEAVGLAGKARRRPSELSGGERQRVALARAIAGGPSLVLADEPTANLDHETGGSILELMRALNRRTGITFLFATHDPDLIRMSDRVVRLRDGRLVEPAP